MASYKWKIPHLKAVQFDGKNHAEVKKFLGDDSVGEEFMIGTGKFDDSVPPKEIKEELVLSEGDWVTIDPSNNKLEVNPEDFPEKFEYVS
jgi:hypothetical protein